jgi:endonuclease-3
MATLRPPAARESGNADTAPTPASKPKLKAKPRPKRRQTPEQKARAWTKRLERTRPGLVPFVLEGLESLYGRPIWQPRLDPISELVLTILTQNTADVNAEKAFEALRQAYPSGPSTPIVEHRRGADGGADSARRPDGWGGEGLPPGRAPNWAAVEAAPVEELIEVIRHGGLAYQKAPRIQTALKTIREERRDYDLQFLRELSPIEARDWLTRIPGIGKKTASIVLLFCFGVPLMPIDTHVERVSKRIGLLPTDVPLELAHELFLDLFEPDQMYEAHVGLITHGREICHARSPECSRCPIAPRCRFIDRRAP